MDTLVRIQVCCSIKGISSIQSYDLAVGFGTMKQTKKRGWKKTHVENCYPKNPSPSESGYFWEKHNIPSIQVQRPALEGSMIHRVPLNVVKSFGFSIGNCWRLKFLVVCLFVTNILKRDLPLPRETTQMCWMGWEYLPEIIMKAFK